MSWSLKNINKPEKPLGRLVGKNDSINIRNEQEYITTDGTEIKRITREYYLKQYANKSNNLQEWINSYKHTNLSRLNDKKKIKNINRPVTK